MSSITAFMKSNAEPKKKKKSLSKGMLSMLKSNSKLQKHEEELFIQFDFN